MQYVPNTVPGFALDFFGVGKHGFQDGNVLTGTKGTLIPAAVWNDMLGNLMKLCEMGGVAAAPGVYTDIANAVLGLAASQPVAAVNADNYPIVGGDIGKLLNYGTTAAAFTTALPDVAAVPAMFNIDLRCEGPFPLTINAHAGNTIEGAGTVTIGAGETLFLVPFGTVWKTKRVKSGRYAPGWQLSSLSYNFTVPPGVSVLTSVIWGAGGSGAPGGGSPGNAGGGGGMSAKRCTVKPADIIPVTVGQGGAPGGGPLAGGSSSFGAFHSATGGSGAITPGIGVGGDINFGGAQGSQAYGSVPGTGGSGPFGGAGGGPGQGGQVPGGGGGGGDTGLGAPGGAHGISLVIW